MSGTNAGIGTVSGGAADVTIDPQPCNALTQGPAGLLVPATTVEGVAPGTPVGTGRSVDVEVTAPAAGDCPADWQVGAHLAPPHDEKLLQAFVDLLASDSGTWVDSTLSVDLPEAGTYDNTASVHTVISTNPSSGNYQLAIAARLWNVTAGAVVVGSQYTPQQNADNNPTSFRSDADLSTFHRFLPVTVPSTIRLEVALIIGSGAPVASTGVQTANTRLAFLKIAD